MSQVMTFKIPDHLLKNLEEFSTQRKTSKSSIIKEALSYFFQSQIRSNKPSLEERIQKATKAHFQNKKIKPRISFEEFRKLASPVQHNMTPEEEVLYHRRRGL